MYPAGKTLVGIVAVGVVALFLMGAVFVAPVDARSPFASSNAHTAASADHASAAAPAAASHVTPSAAPTATITITTVFGTTTSVPAALSYKLAVTGASINNTTTTMAWNVTDTMTGVVCASESLTYLLTSTTVASPATFTTSLSLLNFSTAQLSCPAISTDVDMLNVTATVANTTGFMVTATANATTTFTLPSSIVTTIVSTVPAETVFPLALTVSVTVVDAVISTSNLTVTWVVLNATGTGVCAQGSFNYLVTNTTKLTEQFTADLSAANFTTPSPSYLAPGCSNIYLAPLALVVTGTINGTGPYSAPTGNWWTNSTTASSVFLVPTAVTVTVTTSLPVYTQLATTVTPIDFTVQVATANISTTTFTLWANITDFLTGKVCGTVNLDSLVVNTTGPFASFEWDLANGGSPALPTPASLAVACPAILSSADLIVIGASANGAGSWYQGQLAEADSGATGTTPSTSLVFTALSGQLGFATTTTQYTYNLSATFSGQYIGRVALTIYSPSGTIIYTADLFSPKFTTWYQPKAGNYPYQMQVLAPYGNSTSVGVIALTAATPIYNNATTWHNSSSFGGLSPAVGGTILLVVGLIIGIIVALMLGAALFRRRETPPAQPWESTTSTTGTGGTTGTTTPPTEESTGTGKSS